MQVSVEATSSLERRMKVELPAERVENEIKKRLQTLAQRAKLDGFRPGKVPLNVIQHRYGEQVRREVLGEVMQNSFYEAVAQEKLHPVGLPHIEPNQLELGKAISFTATFEVYPQFELAPLGSVELTRPVVDITEADVDAMLERIRRQNAEWAAVDRPAQMGDRVVVDYHGTINGEAFKGNEGKNLPVELGAGRMIKGFEERLADSKAGDKLVLDLEFPAEYHFAEVAGKPVQFAITVHAVEEQRLPEVNEDFVRKLGVADGRLATLREEIRGSMRREADQLIRTQVKGQVMDQLYALNKMELPTALVSNEMRALKEHLRQGRDQEIPDEAVRARAERRVALGIMFSEIVRVNELAVPPARLRAAVEQLASSYESPEEVIAWYYGDRRRLAEVEAMVLEDVIVDWALDHVRVTETRTTFDDLTKTGQTRS